MLAFEDPSEDLPLSHGQIGFLMLFPPDETLETMKRMQRDQVQAWRVSLAIIEVETGGPNHANYATRTRDRNKKPLVGLEVPKRPLKLWCCCALNNSLFES
jgi:hypothetical protein